VEAIARRSVRIVGEAPLPVRNLVGIGSIVHWSDEHSVLWGCGLLAANLDYRAPAEVLAVRGKLTREKLTARGISCGDLLGDIGLLLPELIAPATAVHPVGLVPHYVDSESEFVKRCRFDGVPIIDVHGTPEAYVEQLTSCRRIVSSSLHGIVLAHAYGIEAVWVKVSDRVHGDGFKFRDYYSSLGVGVSDVQMMSPRYHTIGQMADACWRPGVLPDRGALREALERNISKLDV
jgi:pyruvyltransferase